MAEAIFENFTPADAAKWSRSNLRLNHTLDRSSLFSDEALAALIETYPDHLCDISTMATGGCDHSTWRYGNIGDLSGAQVLNAVKSGRFWINLRSVDKVDRRYRDVLEAMFAEIGANVPGLGPTYRKKLGILISSPGAQVFYHADVPGQSLWQIRGRKRVHVYPPAPPFLQREDLENVITGIQEEDIPYDPAFEEHVSIYDLEPGEMLHWPLNGPHRVVNHDCLNVSLTTEHWTTDIHRHYMMNYANGVLRNVFGHRARSRAVTGTAFWAKLAFALFWKYGRFQKRYEFKGMIDFKLDPSAPGGLVTIPAQAR